MNKKRILLFCILLFSCVAVQATVNWHNTTITTDVVDEDIDIVGTNILDGGIHVKAITQDVRIAVTHNDSVLSGPATGEVQLYLELENNNSIIFHLDYDLKFRGSSDGVDLLVVVKGEGNVFFHLRGGKKLLFTSDGASGGTRFFVWCQGTSPNPLILIPNVIFSYPGASSSLFPNVDESIEVVVGPKSLMSYIALETGMDLVGGLTFNGLNLGKGRLVLRIEDTGGVYVGGNEVDDVVDPILENIHMDIPAGSPWFVVGHQGLPWAQNDRGSLLILNHNKTFSDLLANPWRQNPNPFTGKRYGFIAGPNASVVISNAYMDYVGLANNICPQPDIPEDILQGRLVTEVVKKRNPSAFVVDGSADPALDPVLIAFQLNSGLYFRSGIDKYGNIDEYDSEGNFSFVVGNNAITLGIGEIVFDVEGPLVFDVNTDFMTPDFINKAPGVINILSLETTPIGSKFVPSMPVWPIELPGNEFTLNNYFAPSRTFSKDLVGNYVTYNKSAFLFNNTIYATWLNFLHTDELHKVCENNDVISESAYVGGETFTLDTSVAKPAVTSFNSHLYIHTDIAFTGLDLLYSNEFKSKYLEYDPTVAPLYTFNRSTVQFFGNGYKVDDGSGRNMIFGTQIGSTACDGCSVINKDAHLDIFQTREQILLATDVRELKFTLLTGCNNDEITENIDFVCGTCKDEPSTHTIYLGNSSNISIGSYKTEWEYPLFPIFSIAGNFLVFGARGGPSGNVAMSGATGTGAIFVDRYGKIQIEPCCRACMGTMVVKSPGGEIDLPPSQVSFGRRLGISDWKLDLRV